MSMFTRSILRVASRAAAIERVPMLRYQQQPVSFQKKFYSSEDPKEPKEDLLAKIEKDEALSKMLEEFAALMESKGFTPKNMGIRQQMQFLMDTEVRDFLKTVGGRFKDAGIKVEAKDLKNVVDMYIKKYL